MNEQNELNEIKESIEGMLDLLRDFKESKMVVSPDNKNKLAIFEYHLVMAYTSIEKGDLSQALKSIDAAKEKAKEMGFGNSLFYLRSHRGSLFCYIRNNGNKESEP